MDPEEEKDADAGELIAPDTPETIDADDPHKTEKLTKLGHDDDPDEASE